MYKNDDYKMLFIHNPKCGGAHVRELLVRKYYFEPLIYEQHHKFSTFFDDESLLINDKARDGHAIRKYGKFRYCECHQDINTRILKEYFKFTFVRNPYNRLYSAYKWMKGNLMEIRTLSKTHNEKHSNYNRLHSEKVEYYIDFNTFVKNREKICNVAYFHSFITQCDQLIDFSGNINIEYIGKTEHLNDYLIDILITNNLDELKILPEVYNNIKINKSTEEDENIFMEFNEETLQFINGHFEKDFIAFGYKKYETIDDLIKSVIPLWDERADNDDIITMKTLVTSDKLNPERCIKSDSHKELSLETHNNYEIIALLKEFYLFFYGNIIQSRIQKKINTTNSLLMNEVKKMTNETDEYNTIEAELERLKTKCNEVNSKHEKQNIQKLIKQLINEEKNFSICEICSFKTFNRIALNTHKIFCENTNKVKKI